MPAAAALGEGRRDIGRMNGRSAAKRLPLIRAPARWTRPCGATGGTMPITACESPVQKPQTRRAVRARSVAGPMC